MKRIKVLLKLDTIISGMAFCMVLYHIASVFHLFVEPYEHQNIHLAFALVIVFLSAIQQSKKYFPLKLLFIILSLATKGLNRTNKYLEYGNEIIMPFYLIHQPVIIVISYFVVQWNAGIPAKLPIILIGSLLTAIGLIELLIRPFKPVRIIFGMKSAKDGKEKTK